MTADARLCGCGKVCLTNDEAHVAVHRMNNRQQNDGWPVHAYRCGSCWHVGHVRVPDKKRRGVKKRGVRGAVPKPLTPVDQLPPELRPGYSPGRG